MEQNIEYQSGKGYYKYAFFFQSPTWNELLVGEQNIGVIVIVELVNGR